MTEKEFNSRFLFALTSVPTGNKLRHNLLHEVKDDIKIFGLSYAIEHWATFIDSGPVGFPLKSSPQILNQPPGH